MLVVVIYILATKKRQVCAHNRYTGNFVILNWLQISQLERFSFKLTDITFVRVMIVAEKN